MVPKKIRDIASPDFKRFVFLKEDERKSGTDLASKSREINRVQFPRVEFSL